MRRIEVLFTPAEFLAAKKRDLAHTHCVVIDVLRATSSMATALAHGAAAILPVEEISDAMRLKDKDPDSLLAGERDGLRISAKLTGGPDFDFGNSPREFLSEKVRGRTIIMTTTNGTRALRSCAHAAEVVIASFVNFRTTARFLKQSLAPGADLLLVCGGTFEEAAYEDALCAGAFVDFLARSDSSVLADSALLAQRLYRSESDDITAALSRSHNGQRLLSRPELAEDVAFCATLDRFHVVGQSDAHGLIRCVAG